MIFMIIQKVDKNFFKNAFPGNEGIDVNWFLTELNKEPDSLCLRFNIQEAFVVEWKIETLKYVMLLRLKYSGISTLKV